MTAGPPILRADCLSVNYGGVKALVDATIEVHKGQLVGLIGPNGAGKTTFVDAVGGFTASRGQRRARRRRHLAARAAPARQAAASRGPGRRPSSSTTSRWSENLAVACRLPGARKLVGLGLHRPRASRIPAWTRRSSCSADGPARRVSREPQPGPAQARRRRPRAREPAGVVCLDEPAAGLDSDESQALGQRLRGVAEAGTATLLIDHDMDLVLTVSDYVYVLDFGADDRRGCAGRGAEGPGGGRGLPRAARRRLEAAPT